MAAVVVAAVAAVHLGMRAAKGMGAHGATPARGCIGATAIATADRRHSRIVGVARCGKWQAYFAVASFVSAHSLGDCWSCHHCHRRLFIFKWLAVVIMMTTIMTAAVIMVVMVVCGVRCQWEGIQF